MDQGPFPRKVEQRPSTIIVPLLASAAPFFSSGNGVQRRKGRTALLTSTTFCTHRVPCKFTAASGMRSVTASTFSRSSSNSSNSNIVNNSSKQTTATTAESGYLTIICWLLLLLYYYITINRMHFRWWVLVDPSQALTPKGSRKKEQEPKRPRNAAGSLSHRPRKFEENYTIPCCGPRLPLFRWNCTQGTKRTNKLEFSVISFTQCLVFHTTTTNNRKKRLKVNDP